MNSLTEILRPHIAKAIESGTFSPEAAINKVLAIILTDKIAMLEKIIDTYNTETFGIQCATLLLRMKQELANLKS